MPAGSPRGKGSHARSRRMSRRAESTWTTKEMTTKYSPDLMRATQRKTEMRLDSEEVLRETRYRRVNAFHRHRCQTPPTPPPPPRLPKTKVTNQKRRVDAVHPWAEA